MAKPRKNYGRNRTRFGLDACGALALKHAKLVLEGTLLAIDPSCISSSSLPGWALFQAGKFVEAGVIEGPVSAPLWERLQYIGTCIREEFEPVDVLVIEKLSSSRTRTLTSTMEARGAIISNLTCTTVLELDPSAWRAFTGIKYKSLGGNEYYNEHLKSDERDAEEMGHCAIWLAQGRGSINSHVTGE